MIVLKQGKKYVSEELLSLIKQQDLREKMNEALKMLTVNGGDKSYNEVVKIMDISKSTL